MVKNLPASAADAGDTSLVPGWGRSLEEEMATHSSILAWRIPLTEEPGRLQSAGSQRVDRIEHGHMLLTTYMPGVTYINNLHILP